jgi:DNA primase
MKNRYSKEQLRRLRNDIPINVLISELLQMPSKISEGYFRFLCPLCSEFLTATNPKTNLARCFRCEKNFNPIDMVMTVKHFSFREAVDYLNGIRKI